MSARVPKETSLHSTNKIHKNQKGNKRLALPQGNMTRDWKERYLHHYKKLFFIPLTLVILALAFLTYNVLTTGDIVEKDVSLKGGTTATIYTSEEFPDLENQLHATFPEGDFHVRTLREFGSENPLGIVIEVSTVNATDLKLGLEEITGITLTPENYSLEFIGATLGESFYRQMLVALLLAFIFMGIVVFIAFRVPVPSCAVIFAAFGNMVCTLALFPLLGIQLSTAGIAALLLLVGYSVDTDILLTTRMLRQHEGTIVDRLISSMKTGLTMTAAAIAALGIGYLFSGSQVLQEMFLIIIIGLVFDIVMTYGMNAGLLTWYLRRREVA